VIASLSGRVSAKTSGSIVLEVSGVGYQVLVPASISAEFSVGQPLSLFTSLVVREDAFTLFGFVEIEQLTLFDQLRSVSGVGPKTALAALSNLSTVQIANSVAADDSSAFQKVPGIGAKTAKLIVISLAGKLKAFEGESPDAVSLLAAMQSLGWTERAAQPAVLQVLSNRADKSFAELIRECLALLGSQK
jgi:Holliday junction DNA helicase RuvA